MTWSNDCLLIRDQSSYGGWFPSAESVRFLKVGCQRFLAHVACDVCHALARFALAGRGCGASSRNSILTGSGFGLQTPQWIASSTANPKWVPPLSYPSRTEG